MKLKNESSLLEKNNEEKVIDFKAKFLEEKEDKENFRKRLKSKLKEYLVDCLAIVCETNVVFGFYEVFLSNLSVKTSINLRIMGTLITFSGLGYLFSKGRDKLKDVTKKYVEKIIKVKEKWKKIKDFAYDFLYSSLFNLTVTPFIFILSHHFSNKPLPEISKLLTFSLGATILTAINGPILCHTIDVFRDLAGIKSDETFENNKKRKRLKLFLLTASSLTSLVAIYGIKSTISK
jgi:hypothetical protein